MIPRFKSAPPAVNLIVCLFVLLLMGCPRLFAQAPVFADTPDNDVIHFIVAGHPEMPAQTSIDIAVIEINSPDYLASSDKADRYRRLDGYISLEAWRLKADPDMRGQWYEFIEAKAPGLTESEIDAIARQWWSDNGNQAEVRLERGRSKNACLDEVRAHFQILRTGNEAQVRAAKNWLMMAQTFDHLERLTLPPQMRGMSLLAHLLARDIAQEARLYTGVEAAKLRNVLTSMLAGRFTVTGDSGIQHPASGADVDALLDGLSSGDESRAATAREHLEDWLKQAIDADLRRDAQEALQRRRAQSGKR